MEARFDGWCRGCRGKIFRGQEIVCIDQKPRHKDCAPRTASNVVQTRANQPKPETDGRWEGRRDLE